MKKIFISVLVIFLTVYFPVFAEDRSESLTNDKHDWVYLIQIEVFKTEDEAKVLMEELSYLELPTNYEVLKGTYHRVFVGPYAEWGEMELAKVKLKENNVSVLSLSRPKK
jgi:cell division septation protein DedD